MKPISAYLLALSTLALLGCSHTAYAQVNFFPNDATIDTALLGEVYIGQDESHNPSSRPSTSSLEAASPASPTPIIAVTHNVK